MSRYRKPKRNKTMTAAMALVALFMGMAVGRVGQNIETQPKDTKYQAEEQTQQEDTLQLTDDLEIPVYAGQPYTVIKDNVPDFTEEEKSCTDAFEYYGDLDTLGRCTVTFANVCPQTQPTEKRGTIGQVRPSGWHTVKYNDLIYGNYLYNRCHLIGYQLTGENANVSNLITGTRYLNVEGMLPFEDMVDDYVDETGNHVLYRVTPIFKGDELVARGVRMEAWSVEDAGTGICFDVFCYNVQPGIVIDYATGDSQRE